MTVVLVHLHSLSQGREKEKERTPNELFSSSLLLWCPLHSLLRRRLWCTMSLDLAKLRCALWTCLFKVLYWLNHCSSLWQDDVFNMNHCHSTLNHSSSPRLSLFSTIVPFAHQSVDHLVYFTQMNEIDGTKLSTMLRGVKTAVLAACPHQDEVEQYRLR